MRVYTILRNSAVWITCSSYEECGRKIGADLKSTYDGAEYPATYKVESGYLSLSLQRDN